MAANKHEITQIFLSVCNPETEELDASELVARVKEQRPEWYAENLEYFADIGFAQCARIFAKRWDDEPINDQYLLKFPNFENWEKQLALKFANKNAFLPSQGVFKSVCSMTPLQRIEAGQYGMGKGQETVERFRALWDWGKRGSG